MISSPEGEIQPEISGEKEPKRIDFATLSKFMIALNTVGIGVGLNAQEAQAKGIPDQLVSIAQKELTEAKSEEKPQNSLEATEILNQDRELGFDESDKLLIDDEDIEIMGQTAIGESDLKIIVRDNLSQIFKELGFTSVATRSQIKKETQERREERANVEVNQETIPDSGTLTREGVEIRPDVQIIKSKEDLESIFGWGRDIFSISGFDLEKSETVVVISLGIFDNETQTDLGRLTFVGKESDYNKILVGSLIFGGFDLERRDPQGQEARALACAFQNTKAEISQLLEIQERKAGQIGEIVGVKDDLVSIDLGQENDVQVGMRFLVDGTIKAEKGEDFLVPDIATLEVINVSENRATCKIVEQILNEDGKPLILLVPGNKVRPETPPESITPAEQQNSAETQGTTEV